MKITLKALRVNAGLTQPDVAKAIGRDVMTISNWENGKTRINAIDLDKLCELYRARPGDVSLPKKLAIV